MTNDLLKKFIAKLHSGPGIYMFKNKEGKDLYIGKALNLKSRAGSYLKTKDSRIQQIVQTAHSLKHQATVSDIEALILESQLIKNFRPPFNVVMRDDKQYFYVGFTKNDFPRVFLTHQPSKVKSEKLKVKSFIGPFTDGNTLKSTLRFLRRVFPYCTCKQLHNNFCLNYHIGKCGGICCLKETNPEFKVKSLKFKIEYKNNIKAISDILNGKKNTLLKELENEMKDRAHNGNFDKAIEIRAKIESVRRVFENARLIRTSKVLKNYRSGLQSLIKSRQPVIRIEGYDISNIQGAHATGSMVTFVNGQPDKNFYRRFKIHPNTTLQTYADRGNIEIENRGDTGMLREVIERRFKHIEWPFPDLVLIDGGKGQVNTVVKKLKEMEIKIPVIGISKDARHVGHQLIIPGRKNPLGLDKLLPSDKNLFLAIDSEAHRFAIGYYRKLHRKTALRPY